MYTLNAIKSKLLCVRHNEKKTYENTGKCSLLTFF